MLLRPLRRTRLGYPAFPSSRVPRLQVRTRHLYRTWWQHSRGVIGWPVAKKMTHDDRLFVTASVIAATGFLRGGEFLSSPRSSRPVLRGEQVSLSFDGGKAAVTVSIAAPKARWWLKSEQAVCFSIPDHPCIDPVRWLQSYRSMSDVPLDEDGPAFVRSNGDTLSRNWMVAKSASLMAAWDSSA